jgi:hypothetical protein
MPGRSFGQAFITGQMRFHFGNLAVLLRNSTQLKIHGFASLPFDRFAFIVLDQLLIFDGAYINLRLRSPARVQVLTIITDIPDQYPPLIPRTAGLEAIRQNICS